MTEHDHSGAAPAAPAGSPDGFLLTPPPTATTMRVLKRNGTDEAVDLNKIVRAVQRCADGLHAVDPMRVATRTISGLYDGASTRELDELSIRTAAMLTAEEPEYSRLAARLLAGVIAKEVAGQEIHAFSQSVARGHELGLINARLLGFVQANARKLNDAIDASLDLRFDYFGLRTLYDRYLLRHPHTRKVVETPQQFFLRIACALSEDVPEALALYRRMGRLDYLPSSPTLFNAGTTHEQLSSCFLLDSPKDSLESIYRKYGEIAQLSKFSGGIGVSFTRVRSRGSLITSTNGHSNGIVPWLKTLDSSVAAVNQGGKRKGAACVYLEPWHADVEEFLELRDNTGDDARRTHNLNLANWIPDLFMRRVEADADWSLFDPRVVPDFTDLHGDAFDRAYAQAEADGKAVRTLKARELYARMMRTLAQTGNGWMTFKDACNRASNQTARAGNVIHLSNLCTEILEVTSDSETAVCNLGSINLAHHLEADAGHGPRFDFDRLGETVRLAVRQLDRVIDLNFYPIDSARSGNLRWRPVGLGVMGLQDVFFQLRLPFDGDEARALSARIAEAIYFHALEASCELAIERGRHPAFADTRAAAGDLQFDAWGVVPADTARWDALRARIREHGLRNSLLIAIAPTATIASIAGCYECVEPQVSNLFKRETLSGDFLQVNRHLVLELKKLGLWTPEVRDAIKRAEGSVQGLAQVPEALRAIYRTAWEVPMRSLIDMAADRGAFIDQSASLNLFMESPSIGAMSSMYMHAWKRGIKTTYYLRSRPATKIAKATLAGMDAEAPAPREYAPAEAVACSLENPESCEACQ
ncbi:MULTISPECIES: ribonucleoside-diphosphate reductase subunit alpha [unclassified Luteimonas]|uniref:ribonucleoside-diphosphate reductase subunit alpha n=1 Tax=unclassified Luteimonas TaxID=2629088 RepID=UPI001603C7CD|nr:MULTISPECIES: ribonucleoside-diphosphate reductase subunit alpha [unclassified Luteimonas]MBB1473305.1 ribonucleoside-diphosphate reductase subunit alpha [Luteimonas sp. MC1782]MBB6600521.1 ribonucleoside-diphosphate reductase subunit alpha [Luteimonas sp. MC1825]QOC88179.1 ribonucleoside-diphosphate reductase subunit alpha [Luteimonas sp. MC1825]